jgi:hypothetical protein
VLKIHDFSERLTICLIPDVPGAVSKAKRALFSDIPSFGIFRVVGGDLGRYSRYKLRDETRRSLESNSAIIEQLPSKSLAQFTGSQRTFQTRLMLPRGIYGFPPRLA